MKKFSKFLALFMVMLMACAFVGCKNDDDDTSSNSVTSSTLVTTTADDVVFQTNNGSKQLIFRKDNSFIWQNTKVNAVFVQGTYTGTVAAGQTLSVSMTKIMKGLVDTNGNATSSSDKTLIDITEQILTNMEASNPVSVIISGSNTTTFMEDTYTKK